MSLEEEMASFQALKPRLQVMWQTVMSRDEEAYTSVVVPSLTLDQSELQKIAGASFYEERLLFLLIRLRNPRARMVYVTSQPVHPMILEYYFQFLAGIPASHARARLTLLCAYDASPRSLTEKILERPRLIQRIRDGIDDKNRAYLTVFNSTPLERRLSALLGIPMNGVDPQLCDLGTKSGSRKVFREAEIPLPEGAEDLKSTDEVVEALADIRGKRPEAKRAVVKLNESFSGEGNALFRYPERKDKDSMRRALDAVEFAVKTESYDSYFGKFTKMGGIAEEFVEANEKRSPSAQVRVSPKQEVSIISTHDQILGGPGGQVFLGCTFPAQDQYRIRIQNAGARVGDVLARHGVMSRFGVDFLVWRENDRRDWNMCALEINLRMGGTTHPFLALQFLTGGQLDPGTGLFYSQSGQAKYYKATDNLSSPDYRGLLPEDIIDILTLDKLHYNHRSESGVLFHLIGAVSQYGKLGMTAIANSRDQVEELYDHTLAILDREAAAGRRPTEIERPEPPEATPEKSMIAE
ncbi:MAG: carboxylate-amine ligase [Planctomycetes bacterium]|nr:carboxylate-amine ligase [Planctomycetota bacterium]